MVILLVFETQLFLDFLATVLTDLDRLLSVGRDVFFLVTFQFLSCFRGGKGTNFGINAEISFFHFHTFSATAFECVNRFCLFLSFLLLANLS